MKPLDRIIQAWRLSKVRPYIKPGVTVLDVGCANGVLYDRFPQIGRYVGIDPDASSLDRLTATFVRGTFPGTVMPPDRFDLVIALAVLEHVPRHEQDGFARACAERLVEGGHLVITVPSPVVDTILRVLKGLRVLDGMHEGQHYGYDPTMTAKIFEPHGLRLRRHERFELGLNHLFVFERQVA